jgi:hypothetical protein
LWYIGPCVGMVNAGSGPGRSGNHFGK